MASTAISLLAQGSGFLTILVFAGYFGAQPRTDVFLYVTASLSTLALLITGINASVLIPEFMRLSAEPDRRAPVYFANHWLLLYTSIASTLGAVLFIWPDIFLHYLSRFSPDQIKEGRMIVRLVALLLPAEVLATALTDLAVSRRYFTLPMLAGLCTRLIQLVCILLFHDALNVCSLALGTLIGLSLQIAALLVLFRARLDWHFGWKRMDQSRVFRHARYAYTGNLFSMLATWLPQYLLTGLGAGILSAANYASRVVQMPQTLIVNHVSSVTGIKMNDLHARGRLDEVSRTFERATRALIFLLAPAAGWLFVGAPALVHLLFERGSFDATATAEAAGFLRFFAIGLPLLAVNTIAARAFMAAQCIIPAFWYQLAQNTLFLFAVYAGVHFAGARGYLVALVVYQIWSALTLLPMLRRWLPFLAYTRTLASMALAAVVCAALAAVAHTLLLYLSALSDVVVLVLQAAVFGVPLLLLNARFRFSEDLASLLESMVRPHSSPGKGDL